MENGIFLGLGSNLGDRRAALATAIERLSSEGAKVVQSSKVYETPPWGNLDQPAFLNTVVEVTFNGEPEELLFIILKVENQLGRVRSVHWGPRVIDIDLLAFGSEIIVGQRLSVPHPLLAQRAFVLVPWAEIAPNFLVAGIGKTVAELMEELPIQDRQAIRPFQPDSEDITQNGNS
ncbi:MAG: 2-amino-4-hydroxy-6-hydroxymethyldihydropteridine diphosphokinase [Bacteroidetes bacterium]|nr:2-amino-4-hydroxy-6-hydroxymethyldihydropteridine diphosphokinase [Bacteroidota bacterium]